MTAPTPHGFPDWGRYEAQSDVGLIAVVNDTLNLVQTYGPFPVGLFRFLGLRMHTGGARVRYEVTYYADQARTITLALYACIVPANSSNTQVFPVMGAWVDVTVTAASGPITHILYVFTTPEGSNTTGNLADGTMFNSGGFFNIAAATTTNFDFNAIFGGELSVWTHTQSASGYISINVFDLGGTAHQIGIGSNTGAGMPKNTNFIVHVPPRPLRVSCVNLSGALAEFAFACSGRTAWGGR